MGSPRLEEAFKRAKREGRVALITYLMAGYPTTASTLALVPAIVEAGADIVELGVPFSDPIADGPTIQRASHRALEQGVTLALSIDLCHRLRRQGVEAPLLLMGYYNPILRLGLETFCRRASEAGVDGVIVPDLPPEEATPLLSACRQRQMEVIFLLAPTSSRERIRLVAEKAGGFIYCVSVAGVTGARQQLSSTLPDLLRTIRASSPLPIAVGFGISSRSHIEALASYAEAAIVGSALLDVLEAAAEGEEVSRARSFVASLAGKIEARN